MRKLLMILVLVLLALWSFGDSLLCLAPLAPPDAPWFGTVRAVHAAEGTVVLLLLCLALHAIEELVALRRTHLSTSQELTALKSRTPQENAIAQAQKLIIEYEGAVAQQDKTRLDATYNWLVAALANPRQASEDSLILEAQIYWVLGEISGLAGDKTQKVQFYAEALRKVLIVDCQEFETISVCKLVVAGCEPELDSTDDGMTDSTNRETAPTD